MLIIDPLCRSVEWYGRGAEEFERTGRSELLELTETALTAEIDWPPTD